MIRTAEQETAIISEGRALLVEAGAGTGKTSVLTDRFLTLLDRHPDWPLDSVVAVTFTEKATREMRSRIRQGVEQRARSALPGSPWHDRRRDLDRLQVSTIHGLCARILRENAIAAGIDPRFEVLDEQEVGVLKEEAVRRTLAELAVAVAPSAGGSLDLLSSLLVRDLRNELTGLLAKRGTAEHLFRRLPGPAELLERWSAGLEKMRPAAWREMLSAEPEFGRALADIPTLVLTDPGDKLAEAVTHAQDGCRLAVQGDIPAALAAFAQIQLRGGKKDNWGGAEALDALKADLKLARGCAEKLAEKGAGEQIGPNDEAAADALLHWRDLWVRVTTTYDRLKAERQALDFDDLELHAHRLLHREPRDDRLAAHLAGIRHLMVDEFQDVNEIQGEIVYALAHPRDAGRFFAVGDAKQSIYRFRQAQVSVFNRAGRDVRLHTGSGPQPLGRSFRAHAGLVAALNDAFDRILQPTGEGYADFEARPGPLTHDRAAPVPHVAAPAPVELLLLPDVGDAEETRRCEAAILAERLLALQEQQLPVWDRGRSGYRPFRFDDAAILFRSTTSLPVYEEQFKAAGLPYLTVSGRGFYNRSEVRDLLALLACLYAPNDDLNLATVLRSPLCNLSDETLYRLRWQGPNGQALAEPAALFVALSAPPPTTQPEEVAHAVQTLTALRDMAGRVSVWQLLRTALDRTGYEATLALNDADADHHVKTGRSRGNVAKLLALARDSGGARPSGGGARPSGGGASLSDFLRRVEDLRAREVREGEAPAGAPDAGAVQLMTIHAAKGLEFPVVVVAALGSRPGRGSSARHIRFDPEFGIVCELRDANGDWCKPAGYRWAQWLDERMELAESRRLLYVACTRAADLLILSGRPGEPLSWLTALTAAWDLAPDDASDTVVTRTGYNLRVCCPEPPSESGVREGRSFDSGPQSAAALRSGCSSVAGMAEMPPLARPLPSAIAPRPIAVTHLQRRLNEEAGELPLLRPAVLAGCDTGRPQRAPGYLVGNLTHRVLADWECLSMPSQELRPRLAAWATRLGITDAGAAEHAVVQVLNLLGNLRRSALFREIAGAEERHTEIPFSLATPAGTLHGVIDLLFRDPAGEWRLVDWKTEPVGREQALQDAAQPHLLQLAVYARAAERFLGLRPHVEICFLARAAAVYACTEAALAAAPGPLAAAPGPLAAAPGPLAAAWRDAMIEVLPAPGEAT